MLRQPRASIGDLLDAMTPQWDELVRRARLTRDAGDFHDVEQVAQDFADALVAAFRGASARRPSIVPLLVTENGVWL